MKTTIEILKEARELIAKEGGWGQHSYDALGCYCAAGAINVAARGIAEEVATSCPAIDALARTIGADEGDEGRIYNWNDAPSRTQAEVVAKFDEAIAAEEAKAPAVSE